MTDMEEKLSGDFIFDLQYIRASVSQLAEETATLVDALNGLGDQRYEGLIDAFRQHYRRGGRGTEPAPGDSEGPFDHFFR